MSNVPNPAEPDESDHALAMLACPYRLGTGICVTGCWEEPSCVTDEPSGGWGASS